MSSIPIVPDSDRISTATLSASVGPVTVGFPVFGGADDLSVFLDGALIDPADWTLTSITGKNPATDILPAGDGRVTFDTVQTGKVEIIGEIKPKRTSQFTIGVGIGAEMFNLALSTILASLREVYSWSKAAIKLAPGDRAAALPGAAARAGKVLSFSDPGGEPETSISAGDIANAAGYASAAATSANNAQQAENTIIALMAAADFTYFDSGVPNDAFGSDGDVYVNTAHARWSVYGPKAGGAWGGIVGYMFGQDGAGDLSAANNLSDLANKKTAFDNLSLKGNDIAAAATLNLETATGDLVDVTGNTGITAITLSEGRVRTVRFTGTPSVQHGASLVLPGGANITAAAGDFAIFRGYASSVVRCVGYFKASGKSVIFPTPTEIYARGQGRETIFIPAAAMIPRTTNGPSAGTAEMSSNKNMFKTLDFDATTQEFAQFEVWFPKSWNLGTVTFQPQWSHPSTTTNFGVVWALQAVAMSDDDTGDVAFGTEQTSTDTGGTTNDRYMGPESSAITIAGTPGAGDIVQFQIKRNPSDGSDTLAVDARLHGIRLFFTTNAATDA